MIAKRLGTTIAVALLVIAQGCGDSGGSGGTCNPTPQTTADPQGAAGHCLALVGAICERGFGDCSAVIDLPFSSADECTTSLGSSCIGASNDWYDAPCGEACVAYARTGPCSIFTGPEPQACSAATGSLPLACTATIPLGTVSDTLTVSDPMYDGGHARTYCIALTSGQAVTIRTSAPTSGTPIPDTVLHLLGPTGAQLASNDDWGGGLYSSISTTVPTTGTYKIVVRGYSSSDVGGYQLTVTAP